MCTYNYVKLEFDYFLQAYDMCTHNSIYICIGYTMAASGLPVIHEWSVLIGHEGVARVVYQS